MAIEIPPATCRQLARRVARVKDRLPRVRWLDPAGLHLTLAFLGELARPVAEGLDGALAEACSRVPRFRLQPAGGGAFPAGARPRVLWVGFEPCDALDELHRQVAEAVRGALGGGGARRFHAHVTLARCRVAVDGGAAARWRDAFPPAELDAFEVAAGALVESRLEASGARYLRRAAYPLREAA